MPKRIIVLSDGTGNAASSIWRTNVWRLFELLYLTNSEQVAKYDDGVGSSSFKPMAVLGGAFGWGLKRNVIDLYKFVCRNYEPGSQIYAFGFSRGAFTVRVLIALILEEGLVPYLSEGDLHARATAAYRSFRAQRFHTIFRIERVFRGIRNAYFVTREKLTGRFPYDSSENTVVPTIEFVGVWDTVAAYGLPIEEMTRGVSQYIWPLYLPERALSPRVLRACHALALDDERTTFHPVLWTEAGESEPAPDSQGRHWLKDERISQVWFTGVHANVGGGYPDDALSYMPLQWIMEEAAARGLVFKASPKADPDALLRVSSSCDPDGRQYDSRAGLGGYYRYGPRKIEALSNSAGSKSEDVRIALPKIHESALLRLRSDSNAYAPIGLPAVYAVATLDGRIVRGEENTYESPIQREARAREQEKIWNWVWLRRIVYFITLAASFHLVAFWLFHEQDDEYEFSSPFRLVSEFVRLVESFLPRLVVRWWTDWFATNPGWFLIGIIWLAVMIWLGSKLGARISDSMRTIWTTRAPERSIEHCRWHKAVYRFRTSKPYQAAFGITKNYVLPLISAILLLWLGLTSASHLLFNVVDSMGAFCTESPTSETAALPKVGDASKPIAFRTDAMCLPTKVLVERGARYAVVITIPETDPWTDGNVLTTPQGHKTFTAGQLAAAPLSRVIFRPWFSLLARIGAAGNAEVFLDPEPAPARPNTYNGYIWRAERSGELFLYVNEAVLPVPWFSNIFYRDNKGSAEIVIRRLQN